MRGFVDFANLGDLCARHEGLDILLLLSILHLEWIPP